MANSYDTIRALANTGTQTIPVAIAPNATVREYFVVHDGMTITALGVTCETQPTTGGTYTIAITDETGANNLLVAATADLDASITADTYLGLGLTATVADLTMAADSVCSISVVSNNLDLVGEALCVVVTYRIN